MSIEDQARSWVEREQEPPRLTSFRRRACPICGVMMRCRPGAVEGRVMLTWRCPGHGYWVDEPADPRPVQPDTERPS